MAKPMMIYRGGYSGCYYATRQYKQLDNGTFQAHQKEDVTEQVEALVSERITEVFDALIAAAKKLDDEYTLIHYTGQHTLTIEYEGPYVAEWLKQQQEAMTNAD